MKVFLTVVQDKMGNIWFGTDGLCCYDGKSFRIFTKDEGLNNNGIQRLLTDKKETFG
ncbi:MAG: hypothetical protein IPH20_23215 [Bacteroidales bacterium]|nr:hypothetical protein [Bacteroidales bacterium]